jgi:serine phosphatase RsbU (regulator of sigma subunit)
MSGIMTGFHSLAVTGLVSGMIGLYVALLFLAFYFIDRVIRGRFAPVFLLVSIFLLGASITILGQNMVYSVVDRSLNEARFWEQVQHAGLFLLFPVWIHFIIRHVLNRKAGAYIVGVYIFSAACILATFLTHALFGVVPRPFKGFVSFDSGPFYTPIAAFLFVNILATFVLMLVDLSRSSGRERWFKIVYVTGSGLTLVTGLKDLLETWIETPLPQLFSYGILLAAFAYLFAIVLRIREMYEEYLAKRDLEAEFRLGSKIHSVFIPERVIVDSPFLEARGFNRPGRFLGGDIYHCGPMSDGRYLLIMGDLCGKGLAASLYMHFLLSYFMALDGIRDGAELERVINKANRLICRHAKDGMFATLFVAVLDPADRILQYVNAGHLAPRLWREGARLELPAKAPPLGIDPTMDYVHRTIETRKGDLLFLFTDGLMENMGFEDREEEFDNIVGNHLSVPLDDLLKDFLLIPVRQKNGPLFEDDMSCLIVKTR